MTSFNLSCNLQRAQKNVQGFEDTGLKWLQFSQTPGKFVQIMHIPDMEHCILVFRRVWRGS